MNHFANLQLNQPAVSLRPQPEVEEDTDNLPTLDAIKPKRRQEQQQQDAVKTDVQTATTPEGAAQSSEGLSSPEELEEQAGQEGAFNPETGEINWDCPCLGGMAHGPCGEEFKAAFSCFVYSTEEPKGIDCIEKFKYVAISAFSFLFRQSMLNSYINQQGHAGLLPPAPRRLRHRARRGRG